MSPCPPPFPPQTGRTAGHGDAAPVRSRVTATDHSPDPAADPAQPASEPPRARPLILVAEDDPDMIGAVSTLLMEAGYDVAEARTGFAVLDRALHVRPDLVLLDFGLPEMNGLDVAQLLNGDPNTATIPVVALTGSWLAADPRNLRANGFAGALRKPFRAPQLLAEVRRVLSGDPRLPE